MKIDPAKKYKVIDGGGDKYFGTPESIILDMRWWDSARPEDDPARVSSNLEYIQLVLSRLIIDKNEMNKINDECKLLSFLSDKGFIEIVEAD
tara:strand:+ start:649 stop:924 length:276 start_codon:yes stop_codon:yes gene_type:complete